MRPLPPLFATLFASLLLCGCGPKAEDEPTWVGCVAAFSGADSAAGVRLKQGVGLAVDDAAGLRVDGRRLAVVTADDRGSDDTAQAEAVRLLAVNRVAGLIGGADPDRSLRLARAAQPYGAPTVLPCEAAGPLPGDAVFTLGVRPAQRGRVLARHAADALKAKRVVLLADERNPIAVELAAGFAKEWPRDGEASLEQATFQSDAELQQRTAHAAAAKPDAVLVAAGLADFRMAQTQLESGGLHAPLLYGGEDVGAEPLAGGGDVVTASVVARDELTERGKEFARKYQERYHEAPDLSAVQGHDAARVLFDALARARTADAGRVRDAIAASTDFESLTGPLRFKDGQARRRVFVVALHGGEAKVVQTIDPEPDEPPGGAR